MRVGIIGGGLMGREAASAFGRWFVLENFPVKAELVAAAWHPKRMLRWCLDETERREMAEMGLGLCDATATA